jgi:hypothetical protein
VKEEVRDGAITLIVVALLAGPVALVWTAIAPKAGYASSPNYIASTNDIGAFVRADGRFFALTLIAGVLCGALAWLLGRTRGVGVPAGLAAGGLLASFAVARIGELKMKADVTKQLALSTVAPGEHFQLHYVPLAHASLCVWGFVALLTFVGLAAVRSD